MISNRIKEIIEKRKTCIEKESIFMDSIKGKSFRDNRKSLSKNFKDNSEISIISDEASGVSIDLDVTGLESGAESEFSLSADDLAFEIEERAAGEGQTGELAGGMDPVLFQIYYDESLGHLNQIQKLLDAHNDASQPLTASKDLIRAFHTLYGSARTAEIEQIAELCGATEKYVKTFIENM